MFKITPVNSPKEQKMLAEAVGCEYRPLYFAYVMRDCETGELMGFSQFEIEADGGYIADLREAPGKNDVEAMFILGRQTMNFIDLMGMHKAYANANGNDERLLHAIGFRKTEDGRLFADMDGMFDGSHCSGHTVQLPEK